MGKTRRKLEVPLNDAALAVLEAKQAAKHGPYVFYNPLTGDRFFDLKAGWKAALRRAGLSGITWHTFRHTFASRLTNSGVDLVTVKELLGHSTINTTMRYAHSNHDTKARAVAKLPTSDKIMTVVPRKGKGGEHLSDSIRKAMKSGKIEDGGMAEWLKAAVLKTVNGVTRSGVRIPLPPPYIFFIFNDL